MMCVYIIFLTSYYILAVKALTIPHYHNVLISCLTLYTYLQNIPEPRFCVMINSHINKTKCHKCKTEVKSGNSICCSVCNVWHHLRCSGLNREQFLEHTKNKTFSGNVLNVLFTGVESAQRFLVIVTVFSVIAVTNGFIKNVHFLKLTNSLD